MTDIVERLRCASDRQAYKDNAALSTLTGEAADEIESLRALLQSIQHACHAGINGHNWSITISDADSGQERGKRAARICRPPSVP